MSVQNFWAPPWVVTLTYMGVTRHAVHCKTLLKLRTMTLGYLVCFGYKVTVPPILGLGEGLQPPGTWHSLYICLNTTKLQTYTYPPML
jgi:hypothetical protein